MITLRRSGERGVGEHGWLSSRHTFSFAGYQDPDHMGFRALRVLNEDRVAPGRGFGNHPHANMEIISYVLDGELEHRDSLGNGSVLTPGKFQKMSAGSGVTHSEFNPSATRPVHFYQIWILPDRLGVAPSYEERVYADEEKRNRLRLVASPDGRDGSLTIHQSASVYLSRLEPDRELAHALAAQRHAWLQVLSGSVTVGQYRLAAGDAIAVSDEAALTVHGEELAELLLFDLA